MSTSLAQRTDAPPVRVRVGSNKSPRHLRANGTAYLMIAPLAILLGIFVIWPLVYAFKLSMNDTKYDGTSTFVGAQFYQFVLSDPLFWSSLWVGLRYSLIVVPTILILALLVASFIKTLGKHAAAFLKTTVYVPTVVSVVVVAILFGFIYQDAGLANWVVGLFGVSPITWLNTTGTALPSIAAAGIWMGFGIATLIMLAGLLDIPDSYYESAELEGANWWQRTRFITLPLLKNVFLYLLITGFTLSMQEYMLPLIMTNGGPVGSTTTPNLFIFNQFRDPRIFSTTYSITAALILFVVLGLVSILMFRFIKSDKAVDG